MNCRPLNLAARLRSRLQEATSGQRSVGFEEDRSTTEVKGDCAFANRSGFGGANTSTATMRPM